PARSDLAADLGVYLARRRLAEDVQPGDAAGAADPEAGGVGKRRPASGAERVQVRPRAQAVEAPGPQPVQGGGRPGALVRIVEEGGILRALWMVLLPRRSPVDHVDAQGEEAASIRRHEPPHAVLLRDAEEGALRGRAAGGGTSPPHGERQQGPRRQEPE